MYKLWARFVGNGCEHQHTLIVRSVGVERTVCEGCGNVSFSIAPTLLASHELVPHHEVDVELEKVVGL